MGGGSSGASGRAAPTAPGESMRNGPGARPGPPAGRRGARRRFAPPSTPLARISTSARNTRAPSGCSGATPPLTRALPRRPPPPPPPPPPRPGGGGPPRRRAPRVPRPAARGRPPRSRGRFPGARGGGVLRRELEGEQQRVLAPGVVARTPAERGEAEAPVEGQGPKVGRAELEVDPRQARDARLRQSRGEERRAEPAPARVRGHRQRVHVELVRPALAPQHAAQDPSLFGEQQAAAAAREQGRERP